ncbi:MAG: pyridoxal-phosphate dependent enzyme [Sphingobacteriales bacterium]|nr:MAG: pyridoxal-phosphate dependent enzyme [Sphingobacteriales bacterium]
MLFSINDIIFDELSSNLLTRKKIRLRIARLDKIHPIVSGNKLFKLHYFLKEFETGNYKMLQTFGGAYSNHLVATAFACKKLNIPCRAIVRGEAPAILSHTLQHCIDYGMQLEFVSRETYTTLQTMQVADDEILQIPEGGFHPLGAMGASLIMDNKELQNATHISLAVGTATTLAGILQKATARVMAVPVLKGFTDIGERLTLLNGRSNYINLEIWDQYHFGGYAKKTPELLNFMNNMYEQYQLPTDFVYTAKMMYAVLDAVNSDFFSQGSDIVCLHTGGLQGNASLPAQSLIF